MVYFVARFNLLKLEECTDKKLCGVIYGDSYVMDQLIRTAIRSKNRS